MQAGKRRRKAVFVLDYNCFVPHKYFTIAIILALFCAGCGVRVSENRAATPTLVIITSTLPATLKAPPSETPLPPPPTPTVAPVEGTTSTEVNVRSEPSTASDVLGIIPANTKIQIIGRDPGENWWQILYPEGAQEKGWVTAQYVATTSKPEVPVIGGGANPNDGNVAIIQQQLNVRSGPGADFNSLGTLNPQDVVSLMGKDANGVWLQIDFASGPDGKGWISAAFVQAKGVENLPIVSESGAVVGTGTPTNIPLPASRTPTLVPAPMDDDSTQSPAINITLSATGTQSFQYSSDVSSPKGDTTDWALFTPFSKTVRLSLSCDGDKSVAVEIRENGKVMQNWGSLQCAESAVVSTIPGTAYVIGVESLSSGSLIYTRFTLQVISIP